MAKKKIRENLFVQTVKNSAPDEEITETDGEDEIADWAKSKAFFTKTLLTLRLDNKLVARLEMIIDELRGIVPEHLQKSFQLSKLTELCFTELLHDYEQRADKVESVLVQIVSVWCDQNENPVDENAKNK